MVKRSNASSCRSLEQREEGKVRLFGSKNSGKQLGGGKDSHKASLIKGFIWCFLFHRTVSKSPLNRLEGASVLLALEGFCFLTMHCLFKYSVTSSLLVQLVYDFLEVDAATAPMQADVSHIPGVPWAPVVPGVPGSPGSPGSPWAPSRPFLVIPGTPGGPKRERGKIHVIFPSLLF